MAILRKYRKTSTQFKETYRQRVLLDISNILNTKRGYGSFDPDFGMEDISHYTDHEQISEFIKGEIIRNIDLYYSSIQVLKIKETPSSSLSRINLVLDCVIAGEKLTIHVYNEQGFDKWIVD